MFITEETEVLFYLLVFVLNFAVTFRVLSSSKAKFNAKAFVKSTHKLGCKLWTAIREDFFWDSMKIEDILVVKIDSTLSC
jgi:hypothetical protein